MEFKLRSKKIITTVFICLISLLFVACKESPDNLINTESNLIDKINAVQEQVMVQGNLSEEEELAISSLCSIMTTNDGLANYSPENRMILKDVDIAPVYDGCEELTAMETTSCFNAKIAAFIKREFRLNLSKRLNLPEQKKVDAFFIIDQTGDLTGMKVRDSELTIQAEILRVLRKMPVMQPAVHNGKNVAVLCSMVVSYGNELEIEVVYIPERPNIQ